MDMAAVLTLIFGTAAGAGWVGAAVAVARGLLIPRATVKEILSNHSAALKELRDQWADRLREAQSREAEWRAVAHAEREGRFMAQRQVDELMEYARTADAVIRALPAGRPADELRR